MMVNLTRTYRGRDDYSGFAVEETNTLQGYLTQCPSDSYEGKSHQRQLHAKTVLLPQHMTNYKTWLHSQQLIMTMRLGPKFLFEIQALP